MDYVDPRSLEFGTNAESMRVAVAELREMLDSVAGGGEASRARHTSRGKMLARQRVDLLIDPGTAFLELSPLAAHGIYGSDVHSASIVTGVGRIREGCIVDLHPYAAGVKRVERAGRGRFVGDAVKETVKVTRQLQVRHHRVLKLDAGHLLVDAVEQIQKRVVSYLFVLVAFHLVRDAAVCSLLRWRIALTAAKVQSLPIAFAALPVLAPAGRQ